MVKKYRVGVHATGSKSSWKDGTIGKGKRVIEPGTDPYSFFEDIFYTIPEPQKKNKPDDYIYICDRRDEKTGHIKDEKGKTRWAAKYGKPTPLFADILCNEGIDPYLLGGCEIIHWQDGRTLMVVKASNHIFTMWMCLDVPETCIINLTSGTVTQILDEKEEG